MVRRRTPFVAPTLGTPSRRDGSNPSSCPAGDAKGGKAIDLALCDRGAEIWVDL